MSETFSALFDQIMQCEKRVEAKHRLLGELKSQTKQLKSSIQKLSEKQTILQHKLLSQVESQSDKEIQHQVLERREKILVDQKNELMKENLSLTEELESLQETLEDEMSGFCTLVEKHSADLDLTQYGKQVREQKSKDTLVQMLEEERKLKEELKTYEEHKDNIQKLETERIFLQQSIADLEETKSEAEKLVRAQKENIEELKLHHDHVMNIPLEGKEFLSLKKELSALNTDALEAECQQLHEQIRVLQEKVQMRQRQQMRCSRMLPSSHNTDFRAASSMLQESSDFHTDIGNRDNLGRSDLLLPAQECEMEEEYESVQMEEDESFLPDLDLNSPVPSSVFRVCNRRKPVFKPTKKC